MQWPEFTELNDVTITPLYPGSSKSGGLKLAASQQAAVFGHYRYGRPESILEIMPSSKEEVRRAHIVEEPTIYGGLLFPHFGHALAESIHRLWPLFAKPSLQNSKVLFVPVKGARITPYLCEALDLFGVSEDKIIRMMHPMRFRRLIVAPQARQMAGPTLIENYREMLETSLERRFPSKDRERRLYISRLDYLADGSFFGESELSRQLAVWGFEIVRPERHSLAALVGMLRECKLAIFAEGSALHALELCGSRVPDVLVIGRRPRSFKRFARLLKDICRRWMISEHILFVAGMSENPKKHSGVLDLPAVMSDIQAFVGVSQESQWSSAWARKAIEEDTERLINGVEHENREDCARLGAELKSAIGQRLNELA